MDLSLRQVLPISSIEVPHFFSLDQHPPRVRERNLREKKMGTLQFLRKAYSAIKGTSVSLAYVNSNYGIILKWFGSFQIVNFQIEFTTKASTNKLSIIMSSNQFEGKVFSSLLQAWELKLSRNKFLDLFTFLRDKIITANWAILDFIKQ